MGTRVHGYTGTRVKTCRLLLVNVTVAFGKYVRTSMLDKSPVTKVTGQFAMQNINNYVHHDCEWRGWMVDLNTVRANGVYPVQMSLPTATELLGKTQSKSLTHKKKHSKNQSYNPDKKINSTGRFQAGANCAATAQNGSCACRRSLHWPRRRDLMYCLHSLHRPTDMVVDDCTLYNSIINCNVSPKLIQKSHSPATSRYGAWARSVDDRRTGPHPNDKRSNQLYRCHRNLPARRVHLLLTGILVLTA